MAVIVNILDQVLYLYSMVIIVYILMSWFPLSGVFADIYAALGNICEPYLGIFRRVIPPMGMLDISPIVALLVLGLVRSLVRQLF